MSTLVERQPIMIIAAINVINGLLVIANIDGTNAASIDVWITRSSADYYLAKTISVPADATLVVIDKNMGLYLMESDILKIQASAAGDLSAVCSYEEIDDA